MLIELYVKFQIVQDVIDTFNFSASVTAFFHCEKPCNIKSDHACPQKLNDTV